MPVRKTPDGRIVEDKTEPVEIGQRRESSEDTPTTGGKTLLSSGNGSSSSSGGDALDDKTQIVGGEGHEDRTHTPSASAPQSGEKTHSLKKNTPDNTPSDDGRTRIYREGGEESSEQKSENPDPVVGWLVVEAGPGKGYSLPLGIGMNAIGRSKDQRVALTFGDQTISSEKHFFISYEPRSRGFAIHRGDSANLTYLNGEPVYGSMELLNYSQIEAGATTLRFVALCGEYFDWQ